MKEDTMSSKWKLRDRKERKHYTDDWCLGDEEIEPRHTFDLDDKLTTNRFEPGFVKEMQGKDFNLAYIQRHGFTTPVLVRDKADLGIKVPSQSFSVNDVRMCVGSRRLLDVMDVNTQKNVEMTMKEWQKYYENSEKDKLLNVISLEFSHTKLENYIHAPSLVRQLDWVDTVWPRHLKEQQTESTNAMPEMMYPKVQKYCLMSVKGCYTDFHVDFGGTSVWYHILKGGKIFWLIPPTEKNLSSYQAWVLSGKQADVFFGDTVEKCSRVNIAAGQTLFIPTGWIHAVYTPADSLVFGGNFLHSFGIEKQLKTAHLEDVTHVPQKFRYPFFTEMLWYVLARYVQCLLGHTHLDADSENEKDSETALPYADDELANRDATAKVAPPRQHVHLTQHELHGLKAIVMYLHTLPINKKNVPELITDPIALIRDVRKVVELHRHDSPELAITGRCVLPRQGPVLLGAERLRGPGRIPLAAKRNINSPSPNKVGRPRLNGAGRGGGAASNASNTTHVAPAISTSTPTMLGTITQSSTMTPHSTNTSMSHITTATSTTNSFNNHNNSAPTLTPGGGHSTKGNSGPRRRRTRCKKCAACNKSDCGDCAFCLDMVKFGGPGRAKQTCITRQCLQPCLPVTATCLHCALDGWGKKPVVPVGKNVKGQEIPSSLMECSVCYEIIHPDCLRLMCPDVDGFVNEDLPNSWECPKCCKSGKNIDYRPRHFRARHKSNDFRRLSDGMDVSDDEGGGQQLQSNNSFEINQLHQGDQIQHSQSERRLHQRNDESEALRMDEELDEECDDEEEEEYEENSRSSFSRKLSSPAQRIINNGDEGSSEDDQSIQEEEELEEEEDEEDISENEINEDKEMIKVEIKDVKIIPGVNTSPYKSPNIKQELAEPSPKKLKLESGEPSSSTNMKMLDIQKEEEVWSNQPFTPHINNNSNNNLTDAKKLAFRARLAQELRENSAKQIKLPVYVVRPSSSSSNFTIIEADSSSGKENIKLNPLLKKEFLNELFKYMSPRDLERCAAVCKTWNRVLDDPGLWQTLDSSHSVITPERLVAMVKRQPEKLILDWANIQPRQLSWLIVRLPQLRNLSLQGCHWTLVASLHSCVCPPLHTLDLSFVGCLSDNIIHDLLSSPNDSRPGLTETKSRLTHLRDFRLAGSNITDLSLKYISHQLPNLVELDVSSCSRVTDTGVNYLSTPPAHSVTKLRHLNLATCKFITDLSLEYLQRCESLVRLDLRHGGQGITQAAVARFAVRSPHDLYVRDIRLILQREKKH